MRVGWAAAGIGLLFAGCEPATTYAVRSRHFTAEVDRSWKMDVLEVPLESHVFRTGDGVEVRLFAWLDSRPDEAPTDLVYRELLRHRSTRGLVLPESERSCGHRDRRLRVMESDADVREYLAIDGQYTMVVGVRSNGTLLGAVARDRRLVDCADATALASTLQSLLSRVQPTDPTALGPSEMGRAPLPGRPLVPL